MQRVVVVDCGSGNLHSVKKAVVRSALDINIEITVNVSSNPKDIVHADRIILPGVGSYIDCKSGLVAVPGMIDALHEVVINKGRAFLGICVGMQLLATRGFEFGETTGFDWIAGDVVAISPKDRSFKIPHMGWNILYKCHDHKLFNGIKFDYQAPHAYFVHSFHMLPREHKHVLAETDYGCNINAVIGRDNIVGTQFHPEKSQSLGLQFLKNFLQWFP
ncbi:MAG: imidazole glycerol phosphate synthase subunit HisH [Hyphomicrobiaceae bacterium]|nr:imidazole glycerol phosphate synthase subunit HisH [Hyphomicrobiaceae bacterium]